MESMTKSAKNTQMNAELVTKEEERDHEENK